MSPLPSSPACERNKAPIGDALTDLIEAGQRVLEIGSGTGQHVEYFGARFPHVEWQPSDVDPEAGGLAARVLAAALPNLEQPLAFDLAEPPETGLFDGIYAANVLHIAAANLAERFFSIAHDRLPRAGWLAVYGPFKVGGEFASEGDRCLDAWARQSFPGAGVRDLEWIVERAGENDLDLQDNRLLPANNRMLVFRRG